MHVVHSGGYRIMLVLGRHTLYRVLCSRFEGSSIWPHKLIVVNGGEERILREESKEHKEEVRV